MNYPVDIESLAKNFPPGFEVSPLLSDFANWLKAQVAGSVGYFRLQSDRFNDYWIENGADLCANFAFFMRDPTGGQIGYWLYDGPETVYPPVVLVGSEGELNIISDTLEVFLHRLAEGTTKVHDLDSDGQDSAGRTELVKWLDSRNVASEFDDPQCHPDLEQWMKEWGQRQRDLINGDALHLQIADRLRRFVKPNAKPWEMAKFDVLLVGTQFRMWHRSFGPQPMPQAEVADLEPVFRAVREQRARKIPERGLWFSSWVKVGSTGAASLCCNFMDEPKILDERPIISTSDYQQDFIAFPRSKHWIPKWLEAAG